MRSRDPFVRSRTATRLGVFAPAGLAAAVMVSAAPAASAAILANYPFTGGSAASTDDDPGSTAANVALTATGSSISATSHNLFLRSSDTTATTEAQAIGSNTYVAFTVTPTGGNNLDLASLAFSSGASNSDSDDVSITASVAVKSSVGGFGVGDPTLGTFAKTVANGNGGAGVLDPRTIDLTTFGSAFQDLTDPVEFRFYLFDGTNGSNKINRLDSVVLEGTAVPEPAAAAGLSAAAAAGLLLRRRRRR